MGETNTTYAAMLKEFYTEKRVENIVFRNAPCLAMMPKNSNIEGESWDVPILIGDPQAGSATFATALANKTNTSSKKFQITMADDYAIASISRKVIKSSESDKGAFLRAAKVNIDGALNVAKQSLGIQLFGNGAGARGVIGSIATNVITLADTKDVVRFQKGMKLQYCDTETGGTLGDSGAEETVQSVDYSAGTITLANIAANWGSAVATDFLYRSGDYDATLKGLGAWLPSTAPSSGDSFFGVDRSVHVTGLAGVRYDASATSASVLEALIMGQSKTGELGDGSPDHCFIHPSQFRALAIELGSKVQLRDYAVNQKISFQGMEVQGDNGVMRVFADRYCSPTKAYLLQLDTWELGSMGPVPDLFDRGSDQEMLREASSDGYEVRVGGYANLACHAPGYNCVVTLSAQA